MSNSTKIYKRLKNEYQEKNGDITKKKKEYYEKKIHQNKNGDKNKNIGPPHPHTITIFLISEKYPTVNLENRKPFTILRD